MTDFDQPVGEVIPGDPRVLRDAAATARRIADTTGEEASSQVQAGRQVADGGWDGPAATAFDNAAHGARGRVDELVATAPRVAPPLLTYADALERLQAAFVQVQAEWRNLAGAIRVAPQDAPETPGLHDAHSDAEARMARIVAAAAQANAEASDELEAVKDALSARDRAAEKHALTAASAGLGQKFAVGEKFLEKTFGEGATSTTTFKWAGRVLTPITTTLSQLVEDTTNPNYSVAERIGRGVGKGIFNGFPSALASVAGGHLGLRFGGAVGGPAAPLTAVAGAVAGGTAAAIYTDHLMSEIPFQDDVIDASGEIFDWFGEQVRPAG